MVRDWWPANRVQWLLQIVLEEIVGLKSVKHDSYNCLYATDDQTGKVETRMPSVCLHVINVGAGRMCPAISRSFCIIYTFKRMMLSLMCLHCIIPY